ncbi:MAG: hypothetical protein SPL03_02280 [Succinivibrio dextrinosolvens]|nr:hypothetical protein [Succinivibrio dextrinosolvens]
MESIGMYRQETQYEGVYKYVAPEGYEFWSFNTNFGNVIWGGKYLDNAYYLKKKDDNG